MRRYDAPHHAQEAWGRGAPAAPRRAHARARAAQGHAGLKLTAASLLESCHTYAPRSLLQETRRIIDAMADGDIVHFKFNV